VAKSDEYGSRVEAGCLFFESL